MAAGRILGHLGEEEKSNESSSRARWGLRAKTPSLGRNEAGIKATKFCTKVMNGNMRGRKHLKMRRRQLRTVDHCSGEVKCII
jgi:hypothetical protein